MLDKAQITRLRARGYTGDRPAAAHGVAPDVVTLALLLLSRADQRSFNQEQVDLPLIAEEATETLLPLAEKCGSPSRSPAT